MEKFNEFKNKIVLVTGGSKGIGRAICIKFAESGAHVFFTYRKKDISYASLINKNFLSGGRIIGIKNSSLKEESIKTVMKIIKKKKKIINILVNNIGDAIKRSSFVKSNDKLWFENFELNFFSAVRNSRVFLKMFKKNKNTSIINIGSIAGKSGGYGDSIHYGASKAALHTFSKALARELKGVRVNCVAPSAIDTNFQKRLSSKKRIKKIISETPIKRLGKSEEVADLVAFLASKKASYINGAVIFMTGGR